MLNLITAPFRLVGGVVMGGFALIFVVGIMLTAVAGMNSLERDLKQYDIGDAFTYVQQRAKGWVFGVGRDRAEVTRVIDGDTFRARVDGEVITVRIIGVDTPETKKRGERVRCFGPAASEASKRRLQGESVRLQYDFQKKDRYGRTLAYVRLGGRDYGSWLVARGYARAMEIKPNSRLADRYARLERRARLAGNGFHSACARSPFR